MKPFFLFCWLSLSCLLPWATQAQRSVWQGGKEKMNDLKGKQTKQRNKLQTWKTHIQEWGLDSNYTHALSLGGRLYTNGWGAGIVYQRQKAAGIKSLWQLYFSEIKHNKEVKQEARLEKYSYLAKNTPFILGKINQVYTLQLAYGREQLLFPALLDGHMSISIRYAAGPAVALLKPYYLNLVYVDYQPEEVAHLQTEKHSKDNEDHFLQPGFILGAAKWSKGLNETRLVPGLFGELAFVIEPGRPSTFVKSISIGGHAAYYTAPLALMALRKAYPYQAAFFVGLQLGKRW